MNVPHTITSVTAATFAAGAVLLALAGCGQADEHVGEPQVIAENGAWTWFNDERAIFAGGHLFVGYVDTAGYSAVAVHPMENDVAPQTRRLSSFEERDDHNNPAFVELQDGRVLAAYAPHHTQPFWYWRHAEIGPDSVAWSPEQRTIELDARTTYSNLIQLADEDDRLYNFFRGTNFDPVFMTSDDGGRSWSTSQHFIRAGDGGTRPYVKYASDGDGRIDVLYTQAHPRREANDLYHVYYEGDYVYASDGTRIQLLPDGDGGPMPVEAGTKIYDAATAGRAWVWDLEYASDGTPVAAYIAARDSTTGNDLRYRYARWDANARQWRDQEIAYAGTHLYDGENHYAGGITIDPTDTRTVYTSSDLHPSTGETTAHYEIYRGTTSDDGATWAWTPLTPDATEDNLRPFAVRSDGDRHALLWLRGRYTTYTDYDTDVIGVLHP